MTDKKTYRFSKLLKLSVALFIAAGVLILSVSAVGNHEKDKIAHIKVNVKSQQEQLFIEEGEVVKSIEKIAGKALMNQPAGTIDLLAIETGLEKNQWVKKADLYIDNKNVLHVNLQAHVPQVRVFTARGSSFYVADGGHVLPLNQRVVTRLPVFTGFRGNPAALRAKDSVVLGEVQVLAKYIQSNEFWMSQIEQTDITASGDFEMIPKLGNQVIRFGDIDNYEAKFRKLLAFYRQVMVKNGWNKYSVIDLQYDGQVVAERRDAAEIKADSLAAIRIMRSIIEKAKKNANDSTLIQLPERQNIQPVNIRPRVATPVQEDNTIPEVIPEIMPESRNAVTSDERVPKAIMSQPSVSDNQSKPPSAPAPEKKEVKKEAEKKKVTAPVEKKRETEKKEQKKERRVPKAVMPTAN